MIKPCSFDVHNGTGVELTVSPDYESKVGNPFYEIGQNGEAIIISLQAARGIVAAIEAIQRGYPTAKTPDDIAKQSLKRSEV